MKKYGFPSSTFTPDPKWEELKDSWKYQQREDREDRDYIGMYEIVSNKLKNVQPVYGAEDPERGLLLITNKDLSIAIGVTMIFDQVYSLTKEEDYNDEILEDKEFWNKHVLLNENGKYKYLKPVK